MLEKVMAYDWEDMIKRIIEGIQNFIAQVEYYFPKTSYNFENPDAEWNQE
jgi:hypothetical protein